MIFVEWIVLGLSWLFLVSGSFFMLVGALGAVRFPDFWTRLHAVSVTDTAGVLLLTAGMMMQEGFTLITVKLLFIAIFLFITGPTASHAVANAALVSGLLPKGELLPGLSNEDIRVVAGEDIESDDETREQE